LADGFVTDFLAEANHRRLVVVIVKRLEDERMHHLLMKVPGVENSEIIALAQRYPHPLVVLSAYLSEIKELAAAAPQLYFDIAFAETMNTMQRLTEGVLADRLLFSTHTPFFYPEAAIGKIEHWSVGAEQRQQVYSGTLAHLIER
jgi:hypothetical protein